MCSDPIFLLKTMLKRLGLSCTFFFYRSKRRRRSVRSQAWTSTVSPPVVPAGEAQPVVARSAVASPGTGRLSASRGAQYVVPQGVELSASTRTSSLQRWRPQRSEALSLSLPKLNMDYNKETLIERS